MPGLTGVDPRDLALLTVFAGVSVDDLAPLAAALTPVEAAPGAVLMRAGEVAESFLIIASGKVEVRHGERGPNPAVACVPAGLIVGEIALLRHAPRSATVVASAAVRGYVGRREAFHRLLEIPEIAERLVRTARQRLAEFISPIPIEARDGTELLLRPVLPGDIARVVANQARFSPETLYRRFLSVRAPNETLVRYLCEVDYVDHFVWVITDLDGSVIADGRFVRDHDDPTVAEIAFTVADEYQGRGLGTLLFGALCVAARADGVARFTATAFADNTAVRAILDGVGAQWEREDPGVVITTIDVPAPAALPEKLQACDEIAEVARQVVEAFH